MMYSLLRKKTPVTNRIETVYVGECGSLYYITNQAEYDQPGIRYLHKDYTWNNICGGGNFFNSFEETKKFILEYFDSIEFIKKDEIEL